ncbi:hypothetical protein F4680DRAFT_448945 [Xylaria scruposa]|nr:hypothetical protein F4680DRAFT_448945 [Xylaria scruposa]
MKITIFVLPVLAAVVASACPVSVGTGPITEAPEFSPANITSEVAVTPMHLPDLDLEVELVGIDDPDEWEFEIWKREKDECQHEACQECVHLCGDMRGYACIHSKCLPKSYLSPITGPVRDGGMLQDAKRRLEDSNLDLRAD